MTMMADSYVSFTTDKGKNWRTLPDNPNTDTYLTKLSHASLVHVMADTGEWFELECGLQVADGLQPKYPPVE